LRQGFASGVRVRVRVRVRARARARARDRVRLGSMGGGHDGQVRPCRLEGREEREERRRLAHDHLVRGRGRGRGRGRVGARGRGRGRLGLGLRGRVGARRRLRPTFEGGRRGVRCNGKPDPTDGEVSPLRADLTWLGSGLGVRVVVRVRCSGWEFGVGIRGRGVWGRGGGGGRG